MLPQKAVRIGFFLSLAGIVASAVVLKFANGQQALIAGGVVGLVSSILVLLVFVAIFVVAVITLARPYVLRGLRRTPGRSRWR
jgi:membrane protein implicated in regulation of membrane protease activity